MLDRGITFRCMLIWAAFAAAALLGPSSFIFNSDGLGRAAMILAALGFVMVVLNDGEKTRRVLRIAVRELDEARAAERLTHLH